MRYDFNRRKEEVAHILFSIVASGMCNCNDYLIDYSVDWSDKKNSLAIRNRNCNRVEKITRLLSNVIYL